MNRYSAGILELRDELLSSIKTIMRNNNLDEVNVAECCDRTVAPWWSNKGYIYEGQVLLVRLTNGELSVVVDNPDGTDIVLFEGNDDVFENPIPLNNLRDNILEVLSELHPRVCAECGKPVDEGFCVGGGAEYYCDPGCLHRNYTPDQWAQMCADNTSDSYWTDWKD